MRSIAAECGHHALTVDLAGGFIAEFGGSDPTTPLRLTRFDDEEQARRVEPTNDCRRRVRLQKYVTMRACEEKDGSVSTLVLSPYTLLRVDPDQLKSLRPGRKLTQLVGSATSTASEYVQSGLTPGQQYRVLVRPVRGSETGPWSDPATRVANV